ncbi:MAG: hypothetical protein R6U27_14025 [Desulfobacterales bacterium]
MGNNQVLIVCTEKMSDIISAYKDQLPSEFITEEQIEKAMLEVAEVEVKEKGKIVFTVKHILYNMEKFRPEVRSVFEKRVFDLWCDAYKIFEKKQPTAAERPEPEAEKVIEEAAVEERPEPEAEKVVEETAEAEEPEPEAEKVVEEVAESEEPEPEAEKVVEEVTESEELDPEAEKVVEEVAVAEEPEPEVEKMAEEAAVTQEPEPEAEKVVEEASVLQEPEAETEKIIDDAAVAEELEPVEVKVVEEAFVAEEPKIQEKPEARPWETETFQIRRKRDWFDLILDASAALMRFLMRIKIRRR